MLVEQFRNSELAKMYNERYINFRFEQHAALFQMLMDAGKIKKSDPNTLAVQYISPITLFIEMCDRDSSQEEKALQLIENHVKEFNENYRMKQKTRRSD